MQDQPTAAQLLADADWLKRLALRLAGNADDADDLVQESWISAWRRGPDTSRSLRPWFAKVTRDHALMKRRADGRRAARDVEWEGLRTNASPENLLEQVRLHRLLVDLVLALEEPYRATIVARFVDGRSAAELARSLGVPESTVRGRLREGLGRLRARLDERQGGRKAWAPGVLALAKGGLMLAHRSKMSAFLLALIALIAGAVVVVRARHPHGPSSGASRRGNATSSTRHPGRLDALLATDRQPGWIAQAGAPARRVAGHVLVDGAPGAGIIVRVTSELSLTGLMPVLEQRTMADGAFDFGPQPARELTVSASMPDKLAAIQSVDLRDPVVRPDALELAIRSCVTSLYGKVLDASGGAISHARLLREDAIGAETDLTGVYELCLLPTAAIPEQLIVVVRADGYGAISSAVAPNGRVRHDFVLTPEAMISGVAALSDGTPVANAKIWAEPDDSGRRPDEQTATVMTVTDDSGHFELSGLAGGRHRLLGYGQGVTAPPLIVSVSAGETRQVKLLMLGVGFVRGHVLHDGTPVAGAHVAVVGDEASSAVSQADGSFMLDRVPVGEVRFIAAPYRLRGPETVKTVAGDNEPVTLSVEPLGRLHGTIQRGGAPVPNALVRIFGPTTLASYSDAHGHYELNGLEPGAYSLAADDTRLFAYADRLRVELALGEKRELDVELVSAGRIVGTVVDAKGAPVAGAYVRFVRSDLADEGRCVTSDAGQFECGQMTGGTYQVSVLPSAVGSAPFPFIGPEPPPFSLEDHDARIEGVLLVVDPDRRSIGGIVVSPAGDPIPDARVRVATGEGSGPIMSPWMSPPGGVTNIHGTFVIDGLAPGRYMLVVQTLDGAKGAYRDIPAGTTDARLVVEPPCGDPRTVDHTEPPDIQYRPSAPIVWDSSVELVGWTVPATVEIDGDFEMTFVYRVRSPIERSWRTFVHIAGPGWLNLDHEPVGGRCPMTSWQPGDYIVDRFTGRFGAEYDPGSYTVSTGFFVGWAGRWVNMPLTEAPVDARGNRDSVKVTTLSLEPGK